MAWWFWRFGRRRNTVPAVETAAEPPPAPLPTPEPGRSPDLWQVLGASVRGASHERADLPNQDAIGWRPPSGAGRWVLLAVADGHGSAKSFRSEVGSRLAVETALAAMQELIDGQTDPPDLSACKRAVDEDVPVAIERRWKAAVAAHLEEHPLLVKEVAHIEESQGPAARQAVEQNPVQAYGTTLITVLLHESFMACLQLGDGDVLIVAADGEVVRPLQDDPRLMANETTSLCGRECWRDFRTCFQTLAEAPPALVLASTDGYANSFSTPQGFLAVATDLLAILQEEGTKSLAEGLPQWLEEASRQGSGDDVTAGIICRLDIAGRGEKADHDAAGC